MGAIDDITIQTKKALFYEKTFREMLSMAEKSEGRKKIRFLWRIVAAVLAIMAFLGFTLFQAGSLFNVSLLETLLGLLKNDNGKTQTTHTALDVPIINHIDDGKMKLIPEGTVQRQSLVLGIPNVYPVRVDAFYIDRYQVTNAQYKKFIDVNPRWQKDRIPAKYSDDDYLINWTGNDYPKDCENHPVTSVSWYAAMAYARSVGKRLPTEAEWEKAAWRPRRTGVGTIVVNDTSHNADRIDTVGPQDTNKYGLADLTGYVKEWCLDEYDADSYRNSRSDNPFSGGSLTDVVKNFTKFADRNTTLRVIRGGTSPGQTGGANTNRSSHSPKATRGDVGFRCVRDISP